MTKAKQRDLRNTARRVALAGMVLVLAGCQSLAPDYEAPSMPVAVQWDLLADPDVSEQGVSDAASLAWDRFITDPRLRDLVALALENNRDLRQASLRIERARALYSIEQSFERPGLDLTGSSSNQGAMGRAGHDNRLSAQIPSYELDLFGRIASMNESALQTYLQSEQNQKAVQLALITEVASAYLDYGAQDAQLELSRKTLRTYEQSLSLLKQSHALGAIPLLPVSQANSLVQSAKVTVARHTQERALARSALTLLVGAPVPDGLLAQAGKQTQVSLVQLNAGLSSEVLLWRPDVQAAEHELRAAYADIGAARAAFYPRITLTASVGSSSNALNDLFGAGTGLWSFMPQVHLPIFDAGRNQARLEVSQADQKIAQARYERTIEQAFKEVSDALVQQGTLQDQLSAQRALVVSSRESMALAQARFDRGLDNYLNVLEAQRTHYAAQAGLITTRSAVQKNRMNLYRALGGGQTVPPSTRPAKPALT